MRRTSVPFAQTLPGGLRVRLRLPQRADRAGLAALGLSELETRRALGFDPRERTAICAVAFVEEAHVLVGFGVITLGAGARPDLLLADEAAAPGVATLLEGVLVDRAQRHVHRAA
jgi:hypothetical protein